MNKFEYRKYVDQNGNEYLGFTIKGCGVNTCYTQISEEEYNRLSAMGYSEVEKEIENNLSQEILCGYGYYGHKLYKDEDGICFLGKKVGSSCD